jgi:hypothetical protein
LALLAGAGLAAAFLATGLLDLAAGFLAGMSILRQKNHPTRRNTRRAERLGGETSGWANIWYAILARGGGSCAKVTVGLFGGVAVALAGCNYTTLAFFKSAKRA